MPGEAEEKWTVDIDLNGEFGPTYNVKSGGDWICSIDSADCGSEEAIKRAHLIAAAPAMAEALKKLLSEKAAAYHDCTDDGKPPCAWCDAEAALNAARGET